MQSVGFGGGGGRPCQRAGGELGRAQTFLGGGNLPAVPSAWLRCLCSTAPAWGLTPAPMAARPCQGCSRTPGRVLARPGAVQPGRLPVWAQAGSCCSCRHSFRARPHVYSPFGLRRVCSSLYILGLESDAEVVRLCLWGGCCRRAAALIKRRPHARVEWAFAARLAGAVTFTPGVTGCWSGRALQPGRAPHYDMFSVSWLSVLPHCI